MAEGPGAARGDRFEPVTPSHPLWPTSGHARRELIQLAADVVVHLAPDELELLDELAAEFFTDPRPRSADRRGDDPCSFGTLEGLVAVTPVVLATILSLCALAARLESAIRDRGRAATLRELLAVLAPQGRVPEALVPLVHKAILDGAAAYGLNAEQARDLCDACTQNALAAAARGAQAGAGSDQGPTPALRVLAVFSNPRGTGALRLAREESVIRDCLARGRQRGRIDLETRPAATTDDLRRALLEKPAHIVHFSGHGAHGGVVFEDARGRCVVTSTEALARLLGEYAPPLACVVLNACDAHALARRACAASVPYAVAMAAETTDETAIAFSRGFYDAVAAGESIERAYREGCHTMSLPLPEGTQPPVLYRAGGEPLTSAALASPWPR